MKKLIRFFKDEEGATAVEYGLMLGLIAVAILSAVSLLGKSLSTEFTQLATDVSSAGS